MNPVPTKQRTELTSDSWLPISDFQRCVVSAQICKLSVNNDLEDYV